MNHGTYYNSKDNHLFSNYLKNSIDPNNYRKCIKYPKNEINIYKSLNTQKNNISSSNINKINYSYNNSINNNNINKSNTKGKKVDYLVYKSVIRDMEKNASNISNTNNLNNKDEHIYNNFNNNNKLIKNIKTKNNRSDINNNITKKNNNKRILSQSINKYDNNNASNSHSNILRFSAINSNSSNKNNNLNKNFSSNDSFYKNTHIYYNKLNNNNHKCVQIKDIIYKNNKNKNLGIENRITNNRNNALFLDKNTFFKNVKEIQDLDSIEIDSSHIGMDNYLSINNFNTDMLMKENKKDNDIRDENININNNKNNSNIYNKYNQTANNINNNMVSINKLNSEKNVHNINYNRVILKHFKTSEKILISKINTEKKQITNFPKEKSEKILSNLTDNKRNNYLNNIDIHESFSNSNSKREYFKNVYSLDNNDYNYKNNDLLIHNKPKNNYNRINTKLSEKINISPFQYKRFSTMTDNDLNYASKLKNNEITENKKINEKKIDDLYNDIIELQKVNNSLKKRIDVLNEEITKKNILIRKLNMENNKNKEIIKKLKSDNQVKLDINNKLFLQIKFLKNQLLLLRNNEGDEINMNNKRINKDNNYIKQINELKNKLEKREIENGKLKIMLIKSKEKQYSNDVSRQKLKKLYENCSAQNRDIIYRECNKSVSISKIKKINFDIPISKSYEEDKEIKSLDEKSINLKVIRDKEKIFN